MTGVTLHTLLPVGLMVAMGGGMIWRSEWLRRTQGVNPYRLVSDDSPMGEIGRWYKMAGLITTLYVIGRLFLPLDGLVGWIHDASMPAVFWAGTIIAACGIAFALTAQATMSTSWRIGIPLDEPGALVDRGPYAISRNPFFLGSAVYQIGLTLMMPSWLMLATSLLTAACVNIQVRMEEAFLEAHIGEPYKAYKAKVRRWI